MAGDRTEEATPKRKEEARKRGQTPRSRDLTNAVLLLAGLYALKMLAASLQDRLRAALVGNILAVGALDKAAPASPGTNALGILGAVLPPLLGILVVVAIATNVLQGGFIFVPGLLSPKAERVSLVAGMKRIFSIQGFLQLGKTLLKFSLVALMATTVIRSHMTDLASLAGLDLLPATRLLLNLIWELCLRSALMMLLIGLVDFFLSRRKHKNSMMMTKQEVKEEARQSEGDPHVKGQLRGKRMQFLQKMMKDVRKADVVVTNPTHFAIALKYDPATMPAPIVLAKGADHLAFRIRELAAEARVPVLENPPLARALYRMVQVGREVPPELYVAVAEVLALVYRLKKEREGASRPAPAPPPRPNQPPPTPVPTARSAA